VNAKPAFFPLGIRLQLTLWYSTVFAVLMLLSGTLFYTRFQTTLAQGVDTQLQVQAQAVADDITEKQGTLSIDDSTAQLPGFDPLFPGPPVAPADVNFQILVRIFTAKGILFRTTPAFSQLTIPHASLSEPLQSQPWEGTASAPNGQQVRLQSRTLTQQGRIIGVVQVGVSLAEVEAAVQSVLIELLFIIPFALLLSALVSYWLAARAFIPIDRLTRTARAIKAGDLHQRVPVPPAHDEVRHLALTLNEMIEKLEEVFTRQQRFVADASHELRTPVAVIRSKTDLALLQITPPEQHLNTFRSIHAEAARLGRLIHELLALARADEGHVALQMEPVSLGPLVEAVATTLQDLATERLIRLDVQVKEPVILQGDETRLIQIVANLLENAILYSNAGAQVHISVGTKNKQAILLIRDTGIGIAPEHLPHLFERFYRVDTARTQRAGGNSGLGLAIVDWVVKAHKGSVCVKSEIGAGSIFTVTLPLCQDTCQFGESLPNVFDHDVS
jgi:heavy metal sensor kinase